MKKSLFFLMLTIFSCSRPQLHGEWTASHTYSSDFGSTMDPLPNPIKSLRFFADSVDASGELAGIVREQINGEDHLIFRYRDTTRYFIIESLDKDLLILKSSSFYQSQKALLSFKR